MRKFVVLCAAFFLCACGAPVDKVAGKNLAAPTAIRPLPGGSDFLVLSSGAFGDFAKGGLQQTTLSGDKLSALRSAAELPILGTTLAVGEAGKLVAVGFVGSTPQIRIFSRDNANSLGFRFAIPLPAVGNLSALRFFEFQSRTFLTASLDGRTVAATTFLWEITNGRAVERLRLPEALGATYRLSFSSPVFFPAEGLLVVFPSHLGFPDGEHADPISFLQGNRLRADEDPRVVSALAVDLGRLVGEGKGFLSSYVAVPLVFDAYGFSGELHSPPYRPENGLVTYHTLVDDVLRPTSTPCGAAYADALLMADTTGVYRLSGWSRLRSEFAAVFDESNVSRKAVMGAVNATLYSSASEGGSLSSLTTRFLAFAEDAGTELCRPAWLRTEVRSAGQSSSRTWLQWNEGFSPFQPGSKIFPSRGISDAVVLDGKALGTSFSRDALDVVKLP